MMASIVIITTVTRDSHSTQQHPQDRQGTFQPHTLDCRFHLLSYYHYFVIMIYNDYYYYFCYLLLSSQTSVACQRLIDNTHLQQLHHGKADISIHVIVLHQLLLQADWLTQIHIGLAQQVEQRHCLLILWSSTLQTGLSIVRPAVQQQWSYTLQTGLNIVGLAVQQQWRSSLQTGTLQTGLSTASPAAQQQWCGYRLMGVRAMAWASSNNSPSLQTGLSTVILC